MKCLNIHLIDVCDEPPTTEVTKTSFTEATGCGEVKRVRRNVKNLTKEERERLVGAMQALIDRNSATSTRLLALFARKGKAGFAVIMTFCCFPGSYFLFSQQNG